MSCPRPNEECHEFMCGSSMNGICTEGMSLIGKRCVILEIEIEASSCNSKYYKAILVLGE